MGEKEEIHVYGLLVDEETRCEHYDTDLDIIAIKFRCCQKYYPCYKCHNELEDHSIVKWEIANYMEKAILCGVCKNELSIATYLKRSSCPNCNAAYNPSCSKHYQLYFEGTF